MRTSSGCSRGLGDIFSVKGLLAGALLLSGMALASCGPVDEDTDPCEAKTCDFGTCDSSTGACTNEESCEVSSDCIPGFECSDEGTCEARTECEADSDCDTGVCRDGGCTNPDTCTENSDCLARTHCEKEPDAEEGTCKPDPCNDKTCLRGVCKRGTDKCVSKESCTEETDLLDCVSGEKCADGTCADEESYCDEITCERGVCSFEEAGCVDASECSSAEDCLEGKFCDDMNTCQIDLCEANDVDCGAQGTCQPNSGQCENASSCKSTEDCVDGHLCVDGTCRLATNACGDASGDGGCPGNQTCEYDPDNLEASCAEPETCETSVDCTDDRRCGGETCLDPEMCRDDELESNDSASEATAFADVPQQGTVSAAICSGNSDFYEIDTRNYFEVARGGTLVVDLDIPKRDRGLGKVEMEIVDSDGNSHGTVDTGSMGRKARARFTKDLMATDHGVYTVEVRSTNSVKQTGVNYDLSVDVTNQETIDACKSENVDTITPNQRVEGSTETTASSDYGSSCTAPRNPSNEKIYRLSLDRPQELTFSLDPKLSDSDLTMSLRERCSQAGTELACANGAGKGEGEKFEELLGPGTYYLVIQSSDGAAGGPFQLNISNVFTVCADSQNYCDMNDNAFDCSQTGGQFRKLECNNGCNPTSGVCNPPAGNRCGTAETIDPSNAQTRTLVLNQSTNEYEVPGQSCLDSGNTKTGGPDQTFEVSVPARKYVKLETTFANEVDGSMYLVRDCADLEGTCADGVKASTEDADREVLEYANGSMNNDETFFLVVDTDDGQEITTADLEITYKDLACTPKQFQCTGGNSIAVCSEYGLQAKAVGQCSAGCSNGSCSSVSLNGSNSDTCAGARNITELVRQSSDGVTFTGAWDDFNDDYNRDGPCGDRYRIQDFWTDGGDMVYRLDLKAGEAVQGRLSGDGDFSMYMKPERECGTNSDACLSGEDTPDGLDGIVQYSADSDETVYVIADRDETSGGNFSMEFEITQSCSPVGKATGCASSGSDLNYCTDAGWATSYTCGRSCSNSACDGDTCSTAVNLTSDARQSGGTTVSGVWDGYTSDYSGDTTCSTNSAGIDSFDTAGRDQFYEFDMNADEVLSAEISRTGDYSIYAKEPSDCGQSGTACFAAAEQEGDPASINYYSNTAKKVVLGVDREREARGKFELDAALRTSKCDPSSYTKTCGGSGDRTYCTDARQIETRSCPAGCTTDNCDGETCSDAVDVDESNMPVTYKFDPRVVEDDLDVDNISSCGGGDSSAGRDGVFEVTVQSNETLDVTWKHDDPVLYAVTDCSNVSKTCVNYNDDNYSPTSLSLSPSTKKTYKIVADVDVDQYTTRSVGTLEFDIK